MGERVVFDRRFRGFEEVVQGGYVCGVLAGRLNGAARVRMRRPVPMDRPLEIDARGDGSVALRDGADVLADAAPATLGLDLPEPMPEAAAQDAARTYPGLRRHLFSGCFCCGPGRSRGDGLRIFPGRVPGRDVVAAPWIPDVADADGDGAMRPEIVWAALDCPQIWALILNAPHDSAERVVTGELAVQVLGPVIAGERYVVVAWPRDAGGRRRFAGAAVLSGSGEPVAISRQTMVLADWGVPLGLDAW